MSSTSREQERKVRVNPLVAPPRLAVEYGNRVGSLFELLDNLLRQNRNLRIQRDLLLPKLIFGEIDIGSAPMSLKEAAE